MKITTLTNQQRIPQNDLANQSTKSQVTMRMTNGWTKYMKLYKIQ